LLFSKRGKKILFKAVTLSFKVTQIFSHKKAPFPVSETKKMFQAVRTIKHQLDSINVSGPLFTKKSMFSQCRVTLGGKPLRIKLSGVCFFVPTKQESDDYGTSYKMGVEFDEGDLEVLDTIIEKMVDVADDSCFEVKQPHNDGSIFFKLPTNSSHSEFTFKSNVAIKPSKLDNEKIYQFVPVHMEIAVAGWYMKKADDDKKIGLTFKIAKITFGDEKVVKKSLKRKAEDDEVSNTSK
jgi:hypothetical protein